MLFNIILSSVASPTDGILLILGCFQSILLVAAVGKAMWRAQQSWELHSTSAIPVLTVLLGGMELICWAELSQCTFTEHGDAGKGHKGWSDLQICLRLPFPIRLAISTLSALVTYEIQLKLVLMTQLVQSLFLSLCYSFVKLLIIKIQKTESYLLAKWSLHFS